MAKLDPTEFTIWSRYIRSLCGIHIEPEKDYLIESRLASLLREYECATFADLYYKAKAATGKEIEKKIIDLITTSETSFFRDDLPFEMLKYKILPELIDKRRATGPPRSPVRIRIWSAGCSTGQEVYSIAITLKELLQDISKYSIKLLGTDISAEAIARASRGIYTQYEIERGLDPQRLNNYFVRESDKWRIRDEIRAMVSFRKMNLMQPFIDLGRFDVIFCRNVAIYFDKKDRWQLFHRIARVLETDGYLIIGTMESLTGIYPRFQPKRYLRSVYYQLQDERS